MSDQMVITSTPLRAHAQTAPGKYGDRKIAKICRRIMNREYKEPENVIFSLTRANKIDLHQFTMLVNCLPDKKNFVLKG